MIKKEYAVAAVLDYIKQDFELTDAVLARYLSVLMEAQSFTMKLGELLELVDTKAKHEVTATDIRVEMPFPAVYIEYTECWKYEAMDDVDRCCLFAVGNPENQNRPIIYMTIHYLNGTQLCPAAAVINGAETIVDLSKDVLPNQREFVTDQTKAMVAFSGALMDAITNGGVRTYVPSAVRRKAHCKKKSKHKLLEYKVLRLDLDKLSTSQEPGGGTHASPRLHLRRGHWRKYQNGEKKWIKPMWVGDKDLGVVHKDYEVVNRET